MPELSSLILLLLTIVGVVLRTYLTEGLPGCGLKMLKRPGSTSLVACSLAGRPIALLLTECLMFGTSTLAVDIMVLLASGY